MRAIFLLLLICAGAASAAGLWRASERNTRGWVLMTPRERLEHQATVRSFTNRAECDAYERSHHAQLQARARVRGQTLQPEHRGICDHLRPPAAQP
jgi:hypothetical protein